MKKYLFLIAAFALVSCGNRDSDAGGTAAKVDLSGFEIENRITNSTVANRINEVIDQKIALWLNDPVLIDRLRKTNDEIAGRTAATIRAEDKKWIDSKGTDPSFAGYLENDASNRLKEIQAASDGLYSEIFVMDSQGTIAALSVVTSDFWQGDEDKFTVSFNNGRGKIFIDKVVYDESTKANLAQVSLPMTDGGRVIGAVTVGVNINRIR